MEDHAQSRNSTKRIDAAQASACMMSVWFIRTVDRSKNKVAAGPLYTSFNLVDCIGDKIQVDLLKPLGGDQRPPHQYCTF